MPFIGGAFSLASGIHKGDWGEIAVGGIDLLLSGFLGPMVGRATKGVSHLARLVRKGGKIKKAVNIGGKNYKSLRLASAQLQKLKNL